MNDTQTDAPAPAAHHGVNVTVTVNSDPTPTPPLALRVIGYSAIGLIGIGFIVGQLLVGGTITFTLP